MTQQLTPVEACLKHIESLLLQTWQETGFGHLEIDSEKIKSDKIRVILRGSTHYRYVIDDREIEGRMAQ